MRSTKKRLEAPFTHEYLKSILFYDPKTGNWKWIKIDKKAGCLSKVGYNVIRVNYVLFQATSLIWFYMTGEWSKLEIDHINRIKNDDRWENLRQATHSNNNTNATWPSKSGLPRGVCKIYHRYSARIWVNGKCRYLGLYKTASEAHKAFLQASEFRNEFLPKNQS